MPITQNAFSVIRSAIPSMTKSEKEVARWLTENPQELMEMTLSQVSKICNVSDTTVLRVCRAAGFDGFTDAKLSLIRDMSSPVSEVSDEISVNDDSETVFRKIIKSNVQGLLDTEEVLDLSDLEKTIHYIEQAKKILIVGVGPSGLLAHDLQSKITRVFSEKYCKSEMDAYSSLIEASLLSEDDLVISISFSGMSTLPINIINEGKRHGAKAVAITGNPGSEIANLSDATLLVVHRRPWLESIFSRVAEMSLIETLYVSLFLRNFSGAVNNERMIENALAYIGVWVSEKTNRLSGGEK